MVVPRQAGPDPEGDEYPKELPLYAFRESLKRGHTLGGRTALLTATKYAENKTATARCNHDGNDGYSNQYRLAKHLTHPPRPS